MECPNCLKTFKVYFKEGKLSHIIETNEANAKKRIKDFLEKTGGATTLEIADILELDVMDVIRLLGDLEDGFVIERISQPKEKEHMFRKTNNKPIESAIVDN